VLVLGRTELLLAVARALLGKGEHEIAAIITGPSRPEALAGEKDFAALAREVGAPFLATDRLGADAAELVRESGAQVAVSVNWVSVIGPEFLDLLPHGVLNAHYGDLPDYRGNAVTNWAIVRGEPEIALSVHAMAAELDAGPVYAQERVALGPDTTVADLNALAVERLPALFAEALDGIAAGTAPRAQAGEGFRCYPRLPMDGLIDWSRSATEIHALVRSLVRPYSGAHTFHRAPSGELERLRVWRTRVVAEESTDVAVPGHVLRNDPASGESWVHTGSGTLALLEVSLGHGEPFAPGREWKSIRMRLGMDLEEEIFRLARGPGA
jgi:methionyl-tRNA formyltransferase